MGGFFSSEQNKPLILIDAYAIKSFYLISIIVTINQ